MSTTDTGWMADADCSLAEYSGLPWLADADQVSDKNAVAMAWVCAGCPVQTSCAAYVAGAGVTGGFWSGRDQLPLLWLTDAEHAAMEADRGFSWVARSTRRGGQQWEQGALMLGGLSGLGGAA